MGEIKETIPKKRTVKKHKTKPRDVKIEQAILKVMKYWQAPNRIKIFWSDELKPLEDEVNDFLTEKGIFVKDIKFSLIQDEDSMDGAFYQIFVWYTNEIK